MLGIVRRLFSSSRYAERGQVLIIFAMLIVPVSLVIGVVAVDASMWQSERRGSQKDADLAALAGAYELIKPVPVAADAKTQAAGYGDLNDEAGNASLIGDILVDDSCFTGTGRLDSVKLNIDHDSRTFFADAFGIAVPEIGAHARACAGSIVSRKGLRPYAIESEPTCLGVSADPYQYAGREKYASLSAPKKTDTPTNTPTRTSTPTLTNTPAATNTPSGNTATPTNTPGGPAPTSTPTVGGPPPTPTLGPGCNPSVDSDCFFAKVVDGKTIMVPRFGATCILQDGSQDGSTSKRGLIDLNTGSGDACSDSAGGISDLKKNVLNGSGATCSIGDTISPQSGQGASELNAIRDLLAGNGTPPVADGTDCDVKFGTAHPGIDDFAEVLERTDGGPPGPSPDAVYQLRACKSPRLIDIVVIGNFATDLQIKAFAGFYILGCKSDTDLTLPKDMPPNKCDTNIPPGHAQILGIFFQKLDLGGDTGEFNEFGDNSITLTE